MKCLITGAPGFIGHHVLSYLIDKTDWQFTLLDRLDFSGNLNRLAHIPKGRCRFVYHDLKSPISPQLGKQIGHHDYILHLAASTHVDRSLTDPILFVHDNVVATANLLEFAREYGCQKFINFNTDEVFGPAPEGYTHKESDPYKPSNPYSATKAGAAALGYAWHVSFGLPVITCYTMNNFGERQHPEKLIPKTISCLMSGEPMTLFAANDNGVLKPVGSRYWMHATNTASALKFILEKGQPGQAYNVIGFDEWSNFELVHYIAELACRKINIKLVDYYTCRPGHDVRYALDGTKLKNLGWKPEMDFEQSMLRTVEFTMAHEEWR